MRYKVIRDCHGFLGRYWKAGTIVEPSEFAQKWPTDEKEIPRHFVAIDEIGKEVVQKQTLDDRMSMTEFSRNNAVKPETVSNQPERVYDEPVAVNKEPKPKEPTERVYDEPVAVNKEPKPKEPTAISAISGNKKAAKKATKR